MYQHPTGFALKICMLQSGDDSSAIIALCRLSSTLKLWSCFHSKLPTKKFPTIMNKHFCDNNGKNNFRQCNGEFLDFMEKSML
jgi:hypothetical protein